MKEIKAYVHAHRVADVIAALKGSMGWSGAGQADAHNLSAYLVKGSLAPLSANERHFSVDLGDEVVNEYKLELLCEDDQVDGLVAVIRRAAATGRQRAGWVYVTDVVQALPIA